jgi:short-subunit dehydrogenase
MMLRQDTESHIVNTASATGLVGYGLSDPYQVAKHGVVSLSEHLYYSLRQRDAKLNVSVLCSAWVKTRILNAGRNRPAQLKSLPRNKASGGESLALQVKKMRRAVQDGMSPQEVASQVFHAIENEQFYILTHLAATAPLVRQRMEGILHHRNPSQVEMDDFLFLGGER